MYTYLSIRHGIHQAAPGLSRPLWAPTRQRDWYWAANGRWRRPARRLLETTDTAVTEIAAAVGYRSLSAFGPRTPLAVADLAAQGGERVRNCGSPGIYGILPKIVVEVAALAGTIATVDPVKAATPP